MKPQGGGIKSVVTTFVLLCSLIGLVGLVVYLLADINHRRFRLRPQGDVYLVERGLYMPWGFALYQAEGETLRLAYAPVTPPPGAAPMAPRVFEERGELDHALFALLRDWADQDFASRDTARTPHAVAYIARLELLPGLSEQMRLELRQLRATAAFAQAEAFVAGHAAALQRAVDAYGDAAAEPTAKGRLAKTRQLQLQRCLHCLQAAEPNINEVAPRP
ncbi:MAG: hypothetical protein EOO40_05330 [Deltaproteobacteria bacterium]|nr:MAG: hypothetical protein EOO40_05330 [Deltaproteobacteria bacterium]